MSDIEFYTSICRQAEANKDDMCKLNSLLDILWTNHSRLSDEHFDFAKDYIVEFYEAARDKEEARQKVEQFLKKNND